MIILRKLSILFLALLLGTSAHAQLPIQNGEVTVENETNVNTEKLEFSPVFYKDGIVFISSDNEGLRYAVTDSRISHNVFSIYQSIRDEEGTLGTSKPLAKELLSDMHEGPLSFNTTGEIMYFTRNDSRGTSNTSSNVLKKMNIFSAQMQGGKWDNINPMPFNDESYNTIHPTIAPDLDEMYFSSDRPGGYGGYDLYVVRKIGGEWSSPVNLGPQVNTPDNEVFPFIHADGTLYFSSNGHGGTGGLDLFYSTKSREVWRRPVNMGEPFNTSSDDFGIIVDRDNRNGYFSSARSGGQGGDDIYRFNVLADEVQDEILVTVVDAVTNEPIEASDITWVNLNEVVLPDGQNPDELRLETINGENGETIFRLNTGEDAQAGLTDQDGKFVITLPDGEYALRASSDGYLPSHIGFAVPAKTGDNTFLLPLDKAVDCVPIAGKVTDVGYGTVQPGAVVVIKEMVSGLISRAITDNTGSYEYCLKCGMEYEIYAEKGAGRKSIVEKVSTKDQPCNNELGFTKDLKIPSGGGTYTNADRTNGGNIGVNTYPSGEDTSGGNTGVNTYPSGEDTNGGNTGGYSGREYGGGQVSAPIVEGTIIQLPNIYYNFNDAGLRPDARQDLDLIIRMLQLYPNMEIELGSHTDARGTDSYNRNLSQRRSETCAEYLFDRGVSSSRVKAVGYGESKPRNRCVNGTKCGENDHQENRRTEVIVTRLGDSFSSLIQEDSAIQELESYTVGAGGTDDRTYYGSDGSYTTNTTSSYDSYEDSYTSSSYDEDTTTSRSTSSSNKSYAVPVASAKKYYVIAGTFRSAENASGRMYEVRDQGFGDVEVIKFDYPNYHAVCVKRFEREADARDLVRQLQSQYEINSYVRRID